MPDHERILVVDDEPGIRTLLARLFTNQGFETVVAGTGAEALERAGEAFFNLAVLRPPARWARSG